jgi:hypothetical protein
MNRDAALALKTLAKGAAGALETVEAQAALGHLEKSP